MVKIILKCILQKRKENKIIISDQISKVSVVSRPDFKTQLNIFRTPILFNIVKCFL